MKNLDPNQRKLSVAKAQEMKLDHLQAPLDGKVDNTFGIKVFKQSFIIFKNCSDLLVAAASNGKIQVCTFTLYEVVSFTSGVPNFSYKI